MLLLLEELVAQVVVLGDVGVAIGGVALWGALRGHGRGGQAVGVGGLPRVLRSEIDRPYRRAERLVLLGITAANARAQMHVAAIGRLPHDLGCVVRRQAAQLDVEHADQPVQLSRQAGVPARDRGAHQRRVGVARGNVQLLCVRARLAEPWHGLRRRHRGGGGRRREPRELNPEWAHSDGKTLVLRSAFKSARVAQQAE